LSKGAGNRARRGLKSFPKTIHIGLSNLTILKTTGKPRALADFRLRINGTMHQMNQENPAKRIDNSHIVVTGSEREREVDMRMRQDKCLMKG